MSKSQTSPGLALFFPFLRRKPQAQPSHRMGHSLCAAWGVPIGAPTYPSSAGDRAWDLDLPEGQVVDQVGSITLPKTNMFAPKNGWFPSSESPGVHPHFQGRAAVSFREGIIFWGGGALEFQNWII